MIHPDPDIIDGEVEDEVEVILADRYSSSHTQHLVRFLSYGPDDDLWLPLKIWVMPKILLVTIGNVRKHTSNWYLTVTKPLYKKLISVSNCYFFVLLKRLFI